MPDLNDTVTEFFDELMVYDLGMKDYLSVRLPQAFENGYLDVPVVLAGPHKAFAAAKIQFGQAFAGSRLVLPVMALDRLDVTPAHDRFKFNDRVKLGLDANGEMKVTRYPMPFDIIYQLNVWTQAEQTMNRIKKMIMAKFPLGDLGYQTFDLGHWGLKRLSILNQGATDNSDLLKDEEEVDLRMSVLMTLRGWIFHEVTMAKLIFPKGYTGLGSTPNTVGGIKVDYFDNTLAKPGEDGEHLETQDIPLSADDG